MTAGQTNARLEFGGRGYGNRLEQTGVVETRCQNGDRKPGLCLFDRLSARLNEREGAAGEHVAAGNLEAAYRLSETVEVEVGLCSKSGGQSPSHAHPRSDGPASTRVERRCARDTFPIKSHGGLLNSYLE
ncbi:hypothetical protein B0H17DRAFT_1123658 [Mycena rosella]|uniref:Uncharacterized protein n=1 Tax=Mycena rosella TaxID=1033263 RepID=A0AAD7H2N2_MYCRO|nr:hypothetical protein B0H17DRAFT_1123658 [Mycena rosella]